MSVVVVTGASSGVGRAVARRFARAGAQIGLIARGEERLEDTAREVEAMGGDAMALPLDVADAPAVDAAASRVENAWGPIDVWINGAMVTVFSPVAEMTAEEFRRVTEVTYLGYVHGTLAALKRMKPRNEGVIVQIGSALAYRSIPLQSAYCAAKHAIVGFTDSLRSELLHDGSRVALTMVQLPAVNTPQFEWARNKLPRQAEPVPPIYEPERIAEAIYRAARRPRREYWVGRSSIKAILAEKIAPGLADRVLARQAYEGQMIDEARDPKQPDNLFSPADLPERARGRFVDRATERQPVLLASRERGALLAAGSLLAAAGAVWLLARNGARATRRRRRRRWFHGTG